MCAVVLFNELKQSLPKFVIGWNILQVISIVAASSYILLYKSKVPLLMLILFMVLNIPGLIKITILRDKRLYYIFSFVLLLGSIAIRIITHINHDGLTYIYTEGGIAFFFIALVLLGYSLLSQYEYAGRNRNSEIVLASVTTCIVLLWLNPCMIQGL